MKLNQYEWNPESDKLGDGSFAQVFKATDNNGDLVALKIYRTSVAQSGSTGSSNAKYSLENEFLKGKHLSHTNVIRYIGLNYLLHINVMQKEEKLPVLIMEFADAGSLEDRINGNANTSGGTVIGFEVLDESKKIAIAKEILAGISYLHEQGIIHRDLKPGNILFKTDRMGRKVVKITDFGISHDSLTKDNGGSTLGAGTINYMAPEQFLQKTYGFNQSISERTDIWAFGIILYRMLTGALPFKSQEEIIDSEVNLVAVPLAYRAIVGKCLQKHASKRYASAKDVIAELEKIKPTKASEPKTPFPKAIVITACIVILIVAGLFVYKTNNKGTINTNSTIDSTTATIGPVETNEVTIDYKLMPTVSNQNKWGYLNQSLQPSIPFKYDFAYFFEDGIAPVKLNGKWGAIDEKGNEIIPIQYEDYALKRDFSENYYFNFFHEGLLPFKLNGKWGFVDKTGKEIIPFKYESAGDFAEGKIAVQLNGKWGFIDNKGNIVIPFKYDNADDFSEELASVQLNGKWGFIDKTGAQVIPFKYDDVMNFKEGFAAAQVNGKWGFTDKTGNEISSFKYDAAGNFTEGLAAVQLNNKGGFIDKTGAEVIPFKFDNVFYFSEGLAAVGLKGKWGFINKTGDEVIPFKYDAAAAFFSEGLAAVSLRGKWGFINEMGDEVIPFKYAEADGPFKDGHALVGEKNSFGQSMYFIDKNGNKVRILE